MSVCDPHLTLHLHLKKTYLNITSAFAITFETPIHSAGQLASLTTYFSTITQTPPASPPAIAAKPMNSTTLAFHATPSPL